ncbi:BRO-N domain-containing protein [Desulfobacula toluolica]|uniref:Predicted prophage antirepressor n=1 Tax=Desulfobacula toluolica (strain DSM 7467 / Tol2) TaxID=651182 RepID=K0NII2_DESTT|nr:BRO family protein [Desulfobacula toluolica]CCK81216.1 predicted prophage antirepressor [Desulfobacula toluolica Tol2]
MNKTIIPFNFGDHLVRVIQDENGESWWVAKDVCNILEYPRARDAIRTLDDDEKGAQRMRTPGGEQNVVVINEPGLYRLIFRSNKPEAEIFRKWVFNDVLPSIRKTGGYQIPGTDQSGFINDSGVKKAGNMYFPMSKLVESADRYLGGEAALRALNYFTGMPVDDLIQKLDEKKLKTNVGTLEWGKQVIEDFLADQCEFSEEYQESSTALYNAFCSWCRNQRIMKMLTQKKFGAILSAGFEKMKSGTVSYFGLRLKKAQQQE